MKNILKQLLTGIDGETHDIARWLAVICVLQFLALTAYVVVVQGHEWKPTEYGAGVAAIFAATGAFIKLKENQEPK